MTKSNITSVFVDPKDVSNILFCKKTDPQRLSLLIDNIHPFIASSAIQVSCDPKKVAHGRGLVASKPIAAGELLFVLPPTVEADVDKVYAHWRQSTTRERLWKRESSSATTQQLQQPASSNDNDNDRTLEECTESVLLDAMEEACRSNLRVAASFFALVGSPLHDPAVPPSTNVLLGLENKDTESASVAEVSRDDLRKIVRANAFGPDALNSYSSVEERWLQQQEQGVEDNPPLSSSSTTPPDNHFRHHPHTPRLLGIYPFADMLNHSCQANAVRVYAGNLMVVHALTDIAEGEEIVYPYLPPTQTLDQRRATLQSQHGFVCQCPRCAAEEQAYASVEALQKLKQQQPMLQVWNHSRLNAATFPSYASLRKAVKQLEEDILPSTGLCNEVRRFLRVGYMNIYIHYFNVALANLQTEQDTFVANILRSDLLQVATQLHFSFCACHNASTEHLSVLHLCYELASQLHKHEATDKSMLKVRFWTDQLKKAHMIRYGSLGQDLENVRRVMQHSRSVLRQQKGWEAAEYAFL